MEWIRIRCVNVKRLKCLNEIGMLNRRSGSLLHSSVWVLTDRRSELEHSAWQEFAPIFSANWATIESVLLSECVTPAPSLPSPLEGARLPSIAHSCRHHCTLASPQSRASAIIGLTWTQSPLSLPSLYLSLFPASAVKFICPCITMCWCCFCPVTSLFLVNVWLPVPASHLLRWSWQIEGNSVN
jgi:hypothetical protein